MGKQMKLKTSISIILVLTIIQGICGSAWAMTFYSSGLVENKNEARLSGVTANSVSRALLPNVVVTVGDRYTLTNDEGFFTFPLLEPGVYKITAVKEGFETYLDTISVEPGEENLKLSLVPEQHDATCVCRVYETGTGNPVSKAWITIGDRTGITDEKGYLRLENITLLSENTIMAGAYGFMTYERIIPLEKGVVKVDVYLKRPEKDMKTLEPIKRREVIRRASKYEDNRIEVKSSTAAAESERRDHYLLDKVSNVPTFTGPTGLFNIPDAKVLPHRNVAMGVSYSDDIEDANVLGKSTSVKSYKFSYGVMENMEMGLALIDRTRKTTIGNTDSSSTAFNLKYRIPESPGPVEYALGYQRINTEHTTENSMDSFYVSMDYDLYTSRFNSRMCANLMYTDFATGGVTRLNLGTEVKPLAWSSPCYIIMEAEQDSDNDFSQMNLGLRYKKNPVFDLYYQRNFSVESSALGTALNLRF
jgi:hypothetical protein